MNKLDERNIRNLKIAVSNKRSAEFEKKSSKQKHHQFVLTPLLKSLTKIYMLDPIDLHVTILQMVLIVKNN